jgi:hypothetical protein
MTMNTKIIIAIAILGLGVTGYLLSKPGGTDTGPLPPGVSAQVPVSAQAPVTILLSGVYVCLPLLDANAPKNDCAFGVKTNDGKYYAVNFGAGAGSMSDFKDGAQIVARGFFIPKDKLNPNSWAKFQSEGLFTITERRPNP